MRLGFPLMLIASLALHVGVVLSIFFGYGHSARFSDQSPSQQNPQSLILLRSVETPDFQQKIMPHREPAQAIASNNARAIPVLAPSASNEKAVMSNTPTNSLALEANPNANIRALPPEEVLSPKNAPQLDGRNGVVFLLDISGSMYEPCAGSTRLAAAQAEMSRRILALKDGTPFAVTLYAEHSINSGPLVAASKATREAAVRFIMRNVDCGGGTNLPDGFALAQQLKAGSMVLITDGDLNIKQMELMTKTHDILGEPGQCPALTVIGIDPRPQTDAVRILKGLADEEGGTYLAEKMDGTELISSNKTEAEPTP